MSCSAEKKQVAYQPCGHVLFCAACMEQQGWSVGEKPNKEASLKYCDLCQEKIEKVVKCVPF